MGCVYFVELASLTDPGLVDGAVLESVGAVSSRAPLQAAAEHLRDAHALVLLDCCEHVLGAARRSAEVLLRGCPSVTVLATSRSPLDVEGELVWQVPSLSTKQRANARAVIGLADGDPVGALRAVREVLDGTAPVIGYVTTVEAQLLARLAHRQLGDRDAASQAAERALSLAEPDGLVLPFAMTGARELLEALPPHQTRHGALRADILRAWRPICRAEARFAAG